MSGTVARKASESTLRIYEARRKGAFKVGRCTLKERRDAYSRGKYSHHSRRLREIEALILHRHGGIIPESDDPSYIEAAAFAMNARIQVLAKKGIVRDLDAAIQGWCTLFAPWVLPRAGELIRPILSRLAGRIHDLNREKASRLLCVTLSEYRTHRFSSLGATDMPWDMFLKLTKGIKRRKDRERQTAKRRDAGMIDRQQWLAESLSRTKPWLAEGISRRTWERRRKANLSADASPSPTGIYILPSDTPASRDATVQNRAPALKVSPSSRRTIGAGSVYGDAGYATSSNTLPADVSEGEAA